MAGVNRYLRKRELGISPVRKDGSVCTGDNDEQSAAAEKYAASVLGCSYNDSVLDGGDGGFDFIFPIEVQVKWLGVNKDGTPRAGGHLIVNPYEPHLFADVYVVVSGSIESGFSIVGWTSHKVLTSLPQKDFGFGLKFACPTEDLKSIDRLTNVRRSRSVA